jgi:multiple inositol-polyphosphate phosphatase / 2,3-bisphosphoglycerate 3-phosphatase
MYQYNKVLFATHTGNWETTITKEIRTKQTAAAFINQLKKLTSNSDSVVYTVNDTTLRFYDLAPAYVQFEDSGSWQKNIAEIKQKVAYNQQVNTFCKTVFTPEFLQSISAEEKADFVSDVYGFYTILFSLKKEAAQAHLAISADSIKHFFTTQQLTALGTADRAEDYFVKGPGENVNGVQVKMAAPLLADFIHTTDAFIRSGKAPLYLRFSHAETIIPFAALLQLTGADKPVKNSLAFNDAIWNASTIAPLSANIQWILYRNKATGKYLIKTLLNEKEVNITGLKTNTFPYYDWEKVKAFYLQKLQSLQLASSTNYYQYLQQLH